MCATFLALTSLCGLNSSKVLGGVSEFPKGVWPQIVGRVTQTGTGASTTTMWFIPQEIMNSHILDSCGESHG
jgi:hypothetical protein